MKFSETHTTTQNLQQKEDNKQPFFGEEKGGMFFSETSTSVQTFFDPSENSSRPSFFGTSPIQAKLSIGQPGDKYEVEADAMADQVVQQLAKPGNDHEHSTHKVPGSSSLQTKQEVQLEGEDKSEDELAGKEEQIQRKPIFESNDDSAEDTVQRKCATCEQKEEEGQLAPKALPKLENNAPLNAIQRKCAVCQEEETPLAPKLQPKLEHHVRKGSIQKKCAVCQEEEVQPKRIQLKGDTTNAIPNMESRLKGTKGGGSSLSEGTRTSMESAFGADFGGVRVHTDNQSVQMNQELGAQAFTHGSDIYFNEGKYNSGSSDGQKLLAHELTHTIQQGASVRRKPISELPNQKTPSKEGLIQRYSWDEFKGDVGSTVSAGKNLAGDAADWAGDKVGDALEMGADALLAIVERIAPELAELIRKGPKAALKEIFGDSIKEWLSGLLGGLDLSSISSDIRGGLAEAFEVLKGVVKGDDRSCAAFASGIEAIRNLISKFTDNPVVQALKTAFDVIGGFLKKVSSLILSPVFDALKTIGGGIFDGIKAFAKTIWKWGKAVKNALGRAWTWVMEQLGIDTDGENGIWEWLKDFANDIWTEIKTTFGPIIEPVKNILKVMLVFSPVGPFVIAIKYGPQIIESVKWLWANKDNPDIVKSAHEEMGHTVLPQLLTAVKGFFDDFQSGVKDFVDTLTLLGTHFLELIGGITGVPILDFMRNLVQSISDGIQNLVNWGRDTLTQAVDWVKQKYQDFKQYIDPLVEVLSSMAMALVNPVMIPIILAGWAWRALPDCYKPPIIDFLLDAIIGILEAIPALPMFGLLWPLIKPGMIGLLEGFKTCPDEDKIAITNKLAKIASGASLSFMWGFVKGFLQGVWEGLTDPFVLMFMAIEGQQKLLNWFKNMVFEGEEEMAAAAGKGSRAGEATTETGATREAPGTTAAKPATKAGREGAWAGAPPGLQERLGEMGAELEPPVNEVTGNIRPAVNGYFQGGDGMTFDQLVSKMGEMWGAIEGKMKEGGNALACSITNFLLEESAEEDMGYGVGWLSGTIAFEVLLAYLTAGSYTAAKGAMKVLKFFAKVLDWTGEVLGIAFKLISKLGRYLFDIVKGLGKLMSKAKGPLKVVLDALKEIGEKLVRYGEELFGKFAKGADDVADKSAKEALEEGTDKAGKEVIEEGTDKSAKEMAEETGEEAVEKGVIKKVDLPGDHQLTYASNGRVYLCSPPPCRDVTEFMDRYPNAVKDNPSLKERLSEIAELTDENAAQKALSDLENEVRSMYEEVGDFAEEVVDPTTPGAAGSPEHKAKRWNQYQEEAKKGNNANWDYDRWSKQYEINMNQARRSNIAMDEFHSQLGWGEREVTIEVEGVARRLDIADEAALKGIEHKLGYQSATQDNLWEIARDEVLVDQGWDIKWIFEPKGSRDPSKQLQEALKDAKIPFEIIQ